MMTADQRQLERRPANIKKMAKLRKFAAAFFANDMDPARAALLVSKPGMKLSSAAATGSRLLRQAKAEGYIEHELGKAAHAMGATEVLVRMGEQARADIGDFVQVDPSGAFRFDLNKAAGKTHLIKSLGHDKESGAPVIELYPADKARETLAKIHGLFTEAPPAPAITVNVGLVLSQLSPGALKEIEDRLSSVTVDSSVSSALVVTPKT